jgi:hypothetical protein
MILTRAPLSTTRFIMPLSVSFRGSYRYLIEPGAFSHTYHG